MMKTVFAAFLSLGLFTAATVQADNHYQAGEDYIVLDNAQPTAKSDGVEVLEWFSWGCPHCYSFEPIISAWKEDKPEGSYFVRKPAAFQNNPFFVLLAQAYVTADNMDVIDDVHEPMFTALHEERKRFRNIDQIADYLADHGVQADKFKSTANSFAINSQMRRLESERVKYQINAVPSLVVNGKYLVKAKRGMSQQEMMDVANYLVEKELAASKQDSGESSE